YHGTQPGDPAKLGDALVKIAAMQNPPKLFVAGSDALSTITSARGAAAGGARKRNAVQVNGRFVLMKADQGINRMIPENSPQALQMRALAATTRDRA
ncbi:MAG: hypothetical protein QOF72_1623, partial [Blastocatellia bacterium]|nr:hypothetical protein [Blastocatellia bacterium]